MADIKYYPVINREAETEYGTLRGLPAGNPVYTVFRGVPYAKPPVGELRWKAPQPSDKWEGVKNAFEFSPIGMQGRHPVDSLYGKEFFQSAESMSEDCLYLNIWTPSETRDEKLPVMFWIHGGGFSGGYGTEPEFDGEAICRRGVILVTINYRLGVLGFLAHPELSAESGNGASGNYGLMDQIAALKWVRRNIAAFGGDPDNITIFGQSAGAGSVQSLMCSPLCRGDFARAIIQSSVSVDSLGFIRAGGLEDALKHGTTLQEKLGCKSIGEMRALSYEQLMAANLGGPAGLRFAPIIDNYVMPSTTWGCIEAGKHPDIPYMVGNTAGEGGLMMFGELTVERFEQAARANYGDKADRYLEICNVKTPDEAQAAIKESHTMMVSNRIFCETQLEQGRRPAYLYNFDRNLPGDRMGSFHSSELWYIFGTLSRCWRPMTGADYELSSLMTDYWTNFAKTGDPNGAGSCGAALPEWKPYTAEQPSNMVFSEKSGCEPVRETAVQKFIKDYAKQK